MWGNWGSNPSTKTLSEFPGQPARLTPIFILPIQDVLLSWFYTLQDTGLPLPQHISKHLARSCRSYSKAGVLYLFAHKICCRQSTQCQSPFHLPVDKNVLPEPLETGSLRGAKYEPCELTGLLPTTGAGAEETHPTKVAITINVPINVFICFTSFVIKLTLPYQTYLIYCSHLASERHLVND